MPDSDTTMNCALEQSSFSSIFKFNEDIIIADYLVSKETANKAVRGQYVNFLSLLKSDIEDDELVLAINTDSTLKTLKLTSAHSQNLDSYHKWMEAMMNYECLLITVNKDHQLQLSIQTYRRFIHKLQLKFKWSYVYKYDKKFRMSLASRRSFDFHIENCQIFTEVFDAMAVKDDGVTQSMKKCHRCKSSQHLVNQCPFQEEASLAPQYEVTQQEAAPPQQHCDSSEYQRPMECEYNTELFSRKFTLDKFLADSYRC